MSSDPLFLMLQEHIQNSEFAGGCYIAGGWVRDYLLGTASGDIDIAVAQENGGIRLGEHLAELLPGAELQTFPTFGTARLHWQEKTLELAMTRKEQYFPRSRHPRVSFGTLPEDTIRRDFTVNALLMSIADGQILDLCGLGRTDLRDRVIRSVKDPLLSFREDPLRMLRAVRFCVRLGFEIEADTWQGIMKNSKLVTSLSMVRLASELGKISAEASLERALELFELSGIGQALSSNPARAGLLRDFGLRCL